MALPYFLRRHNRDTQSLPPCAGSFIPEIASLIGTAADHLGCAEFRGPQVAGPVIGNAILTAAYLFTRSPLSATLAHVAMHFASVQHGMEMTMQLPQVVFNRSRVAAGEKNLFAGVHPS